MKRREILALGALLAGCGEAARPALRGGWVGANAERGHRLRAALPRAGDGPLRRTRILIVGNRHRGPGLRPARWRGPASMNWPCWNWKTSQAATAAATGSAGMPCPLGAHYLPLPGPEAPEVYQLLEELGLVTQQLGRPVYDERHLCHSPQERLFFEGQWVEGLLPPARSAATREQYLRFAAEVEAAQKQLGFSMPTHRSHWTRR